MTKAVKKHIAEVLEQMNKDIQDFDGKAKEYSDELGVSVFSHPLFLVRGLREIAEAAGISYNADEWKEGVVCVSIHGGDIYDIEGEPLEITHEEAPF